MTLGNMIAQYRKNLSITQDALAQQLGVTNQAVSKWESDQCCPDVMLLPKLADIFGITIDDLFGRESQPKKEKSSFEKMFGISLEELDKKGNQQKRAEQSTGNASPWPDDNVLRVAVYVGNKMVCGGQALPGHEYHYEGNVDAVLSCVTVSCGDVMGNVDAGLNVTCGNVLGHVDAGTTVSCGNVEGNVDAGTSVNCLNVAGSVDAGTNVTCGDVGGDVDAGCTVQCGNVEGDIDANGPVIIHK